MIKLEDVGVSYNNEANPTLSGISLVINEPSIILIVGESGSGKSTLAKIINGSLQKFYNVKITGNILLDNKPYLKLKQSELNQKVGYLPQYPADYAIHSVVRDEIIFPLENLGFSKEEINNRFIQAISKLQISHLKQRVISQLSSGELQKVSLATALITEPKYLILDEPFARIDSSSVLNLINIIKELREAGITILIFEHHLDYILEVADRLIIIDRGEIVSDGTVEKTVSLLNEKLTPEVMHITIPDNSNLYYKTEEIFAQILKLNKI